jgi:DNA-binding SARP family transcriptional activator
MPSDTGIRICLLGSFRLFKGGVQLHMRDGTKTESLLGYLALSTDGVSRESLIDRLWPASSSALASQSLNTLVYTFQRAVADELQGLQAIRHEGGYYRLNREAEIDVDVVEFDRLISDGDHLSRIARHRQARVAYESAARLYIGDLILGHDIREIVERERLRARYLHARARLGEYASASGDHEVALGEAIVALALDPCREDFHRLAMRSYVHMGERAQALRQYRLCRAALEMEYGARPERATEDLYELIRVDPSGV